MCMFCKSDAKRSYVLLDCVDPSKLLMIVEQENVPGLSKSIMDVLAISTDDVLARVQEGDVSEVDQRVKQLLPRLSCDSVEESVRRLMYVVILVCYRLSVLTSLYVGKLLVSQQVLVKSDRPSLQRWGHCGKLPLGWASIKMLQR